MPKKDWHQTFGRIGIQVGVVFFEKDFFISYSSH